MKTIQKWQNLFKSKRTVNFHRIQWWVVLLREPKIYILKFRQGLNLKETLDQLIGLEWTLFEMLKHLIDIPRIQAQGLTLSLIQRLFHKQTLNSHHEILQFKTLLNRHHLRKITLEFNNFSRNKNRQSKIQKCLRWTWNQSFDLMKTFYLISWWQANPSLQSRIKLVLHLKCQIAN